MKKMNELLIFFCLSCGVLVLGLIFIGTAPIINGLVGKDWNIQNCQKCGKANQCIICKNNYINKCQR